MSPLRAAVILLTTVAWVVLPPAPGATPAITRPIFVLAWCFVAADLFLIYRRPVQAERFPYGSVLIDMVLIVALIAATGRQASPFLPLIFIGLFTAPARVPFRGGLATTAAYALAYLLLGGTHAWLGAGYAAAGGVMQCGWMAVSHNDRRNSLRDALTGCLGREYGLFHLDYLLAHGPWPFSVGIVDLDGFKAVNDSYGHPAGDVVLSQCSRLIESLMRPDDLLARYGGDEFLIIWPGTPVEAARTAAERIRRDIENAAFHLRAEHAVVRLTVSAGAVEATPGATPAALLRAADESLYRAKDGRNRVV